MKKSFVLTAATALAFASASATALPHGHDHDRDNHHGRDWHGAPHHEGMHDRGRHEGWYKRGGYVPVEYRRDTYVVTDWRARRLREPPRGYEYVRSDNGDLLLIAVATGLIASIIAGN